MVDRVILLQAGMYTLVYHSIFFISGNEDGETLMLRSFIVLGNENLHDARLCTSKYNTFIVKRMYRNQSIIINTCPKTTVIFDTVYPCNTINLSYSAKI